MSLEYPEEIEVRAEYKGNKDLYRKSGPALTDPTTGKVQCYIDGLRTEYKVNGVFHREDGPALIDMNTGEVSYYINGLLHRVDGPAKMIALSGEIAYYNNGLLHRGDGPALILPGEFNYYANGVRFDSIEAWFEALDFESQVKILFRLDKFPGFCK